MAINALLLQAGLWLAAASGLLALVTLLAFLKSWSFRFRLVGVTSFTLLLAASCAAFAVSYTPRRSIEGALTVPVVYDNGGDLVVAAAGPDFPKAAIGPSLEQLASNLRGSGRNSSDRQVHVRLRQLLPEADGSNKPVVLGEALRELSTGAVTLVPAATGRTGN